MSIVRRLRNLLFAGSCGLTSFAMADSALQPLDDIPRTVQTFLMEQHQKRAEPPEIRLQPIDPRLRLPKCRAALEAFLPSGAKNVGNASIGVRCPNPTWTIYQRAEIRVHDQVLVARRFLRQGAILSAADFRAERRELSALPGGYETDPVQLIGKQLRQALMAGMVIPPRIVKIPSAVRKGDTVTVIAGQGGMQVTSSGIALSDAGIGERVRVRNEASQRVVEGTVIDQGRVEVGK
jgi:flagella basal body P-ring formation protein FlgA